MNFRKVSALASVAVLAFAACSNTGGGTPSPAASTGGGGSSPAASCRRQCRRQQRGAHPEHAGTGR